MNGKFEIPRTFLFTEEKPEGGGGPQGPPPGAGDSPELSRGDIMALPVSARVSVAPSDSYEALRMLSRLDYATIVSCRKSKAKDQLNVK